MNDNGSRRMAPKISLLLLLFFVSWSAPANGGNLENNNFHLLESTVGSWIYCSFKEEPSRCLEQKTIHQIREMTSGIEVDYLEEARRSGKSLGAGGDPLEKENAKLLREIEDGRKSDSPGLVDEMANFFTGGLLKLVDGEKKEATGGGGGGGVGEGEGEETGNGSLEGRGHKKKYLKKQNKHLKIILILMLLKNKIKMFLHKFQFLVQLKFLGIALANLLINLIRLWLELKKKHKPNKVIYYEKSHHQHHYDNEHIHDEGDDQYGYPTSHKHYGYGHEEEESGGGGFWPWSRNYIERGNDRWGNPPYRYPGSHSLAYMNQRPIR